MATYKINMPARNRAIDEALGVVCGVDHASGPDRTGLTFLVPGKGIYEVPAKDAERVLGAEIDGVPVREMTRGACCGAKPGERHPETCPRVVEWWSTRCGARPARGQKLCFMADDFRIATGAERCVNGKSCDGEHYEPDTGVHWTNRAEFVDCAACDVLVDKSPGYILALDGEDWRKGILCDACAAKHNGVEMVWHGDRLVRKAIGVEPGETDDMLRTRLSQMCAWDDRYRVVSASGADLDAIAMKYGLARRSPVSADGAESRPTLRIYDATGCVLAEGPVRAQRTAMGARLHFAGQCCATGTAECYAVYANGKQVTWGQMGRGVRSLHMTQALSSGLYLTIALDVNDASEEQLQALGVAAKPTFDITATIAPFTDAFKRLAASAWSASESMLHAFAPAAGFCTFIANLKAYDARERREKAERRQREAALVALVRDVPTWADPTGWRSAVLAVVEAYKANRVPVPPLDDHFTAWLLHSLLEGVDDCTADTPYAAGHDAYLRAMEAHKAPAPEKRRGGKAVRLTVDDGRDDD